MVTLVELTIHNAHHNIAQSFISFRKSLSDVDFKFVGISCTWASQHPKFESPPHRVVFDELFHAKSCLGCNHSLVNWDILSYIYCMQAECLESMVLLWIMDHSPALPFFCVHLWHLPPYYICGWLLECSKNDCVTHEFLMKLQVFHGTMAKKCITKSQEFLGTSVFSFA